MSTLTLVRHAQARFLTDDYDRLSDLGRRQAALLGQWLARLPRAPDRWVCGPRLRQRDTARILAQYCAPDAQVEEIAELDEYPAEDILEALAAGELVNDPGARAELRIFSSDAGARERGRALDRLLQIALGRWAEGVALPPSVESFAEFSARTLRALARLTERPDSGQHVVAVSSAGTIGAIVGQVLAAPSTTQLELGWAINNTGLAELRFSPGRVGLLRFNVLAHLDEHAHHTHR